MPTVTFNTFDELEDYVNTYIIPNGMQLIEGQEHNNVEIGLIDFIRKSPLNWETAKVESSGGAISASRPVNVFISTVPTSLTWADNVYNEFVFINTTAGDIPLLSGTYYYDINLQAVDFIPAKSIVNIAKASNSLWVVSSVPYSGSAAALPPLIGIVGGGGSDDPVSDQPIFQSPKLVGLGSANDGKIKIEIDDVILSNFGVNSSFDFDNITGEIDLTPNNFIEGSGLYINLNQ